MIAPDYKTKFEEALAELNSAQADHFEAKKRESIARNESCTALNRLNTAQKAFDAMTKDLREGVAKVAHDSEWASVNRRAHMVSE